MTILNSHSFFYYIYRYLKHGVLRYFCNDALGDGTNATWGTYNHASWWLLTWCQDTENIPSHQQEKKLLPLFFSDHTFPDFWNTHHDSKMALPLSNRLVHESSTATVYSTIPVTLNIVICVVHEFGKGICWCRGHIKILKSQPLCQKKVSVLQSLDLGESPAIFWPY